MGKIFKIKKTKQKKPDAVLPKYGDTSARCTSFEPYFNTGNSTPILC